MATLQSGQPLPPLVFGTGFRPQGRRGSVKAALAAGYRAIDTASSHKFHDEALDGNQLIDGLISKDGIASIKEVFVQSKFTPAEWHVEPRPFNLEDGLQTRVMKSVLKSSQDLRVDVLDAYLLHGPLDTIDKTMIAWKTLEDIVAHGGIRYLGICNVDIFTLEQVFAAATVKPAVVQNKLREENDYDRKVKDFCAAHGIVYQVFGVLWQNNQGLLHSEVVRGHAKAKNWSPIQALYNLLVVSAQQKGLQLSIVDGASSAQNMNDNLTAVVDQSDIKNETLQEALRLLHWID